MNRRGFIRSATLLSAAVASGAWTEHALAKRTSGRIVILHTNDVHSRIDPFPMNDPKFPGAGGFAKRASLIRQIRSENEHVLLFDAGDIFQGTPYFNLFQGEPEIRLMNEMGYDAATIGNHDFDGGIDNLARRIKEARFSFINANYDFSGTPLDGLCQPMKTFVAGNYKVGVFGIGIELNGLVAPAMSGSVRYLDPVINASKMARLLRKEHGCDLVICLSHLGYSYDNEKISDVKLAGLTEGIDLIIGGHTHSFLDEPARIRNAGGTTTLVAQAGWGGIRLGRVDFLFGQEYTEKILSYSDAKTFYYAIA